MIRFHSKYQIDDITGCWNWTASKDRHGYGRFHLDGKNRSAHRVSWFLHNGEIPKKDSSHGVCVLHRCDNRACVNIEHLFLGSIQDNIADMIDKNRQNQLSGENHNLAKLSIDEVKHIKVLVKSDLKLREIADRFCVAISTIADIKYGKSWKNINEK